ncbi:DEKNAAC105288 [Brettanomyces naardenensis]|uniref:DEKNAAC105288 n=1 Tax=Brettanomyces naardenensis TaxID=13370 RepID=A0A448YT27_BRENA|nr:DEKNAAC105288 [Brettanomyces naardenensis]
MPTNNSEPRKFKLPKKVLQEMKVSATETTTSNPTTADEFFDLGTQAEESGDRWLSSDLSKALRFYQRAYAYYIQALQVDTSHLDTRYNASRLLFTVYTEYIKNEGINLTDLHNCDEALAGNDNSVIQPLGNITRFFQTSIDLITTAGDRFPWDLYYNAAICYFEYVEELTRNGYGTESQFGEAVSGMRASEGLLSSVLEYQVKEVERLVGIGREGAEEERQNVQEEQEGHLPDDASPVGAMEDAVLPSSIQETCVNCYRLVSTLYEDCWSEERLSLVEGASSEFLGRVDSISSELLNSFTTPGNDLVPALTSDEVYELELSKLSLLASKCLEFSDCEAVWKSTPLEERADKLLVEAGSYRTILDKSDEAERVVSDDLKWKILSIMDQKYKAAYRHLKEDLDKIKNGSVKDTGDDKSDLLSQICSVFIEQADIDLERSMLKESEASKYHDVLLKNCGNLLKNSLVYSKQTGGLRESVSGKLLRSKRRRETVIRMCILGGKVSSSELEREVGEGWVQEMEELAEAGPYEQQAKSLLG